MTPRGRSRFTLPSRVEPCNGDYDARFVIVVEADIPPGILAVTWHPLPCGARSSAISPETTLTLGCWSSSIGLAAQPSRRCAIEDATSPRPKPGARSHSVGPLTSCRRRP